MRTPKRAAPPDKSKPKEQEVKVVTSPVPTITGELAAPHMGEQFTTVYHSSYHSIPPHRMEPPREYEDHENSDSDYFHTGSQKAALERAKDTFSSSDRKKRRFLHAYSLDLSKAHPVVYGDVEPNPELDKELKKKNVLQSGLFETVPLYGRDLEDIKSPVGYRNSAEDVGSVSYAIHKSNVAKRNMDYKDTDSVKYLGVQEIHWPDNG